MKNMHNPNLSQNETFLALKLAVIIFIGLSIVAIVMQLTFAELEKFDSRVIVILITSTIMHFILKKIETKNK